MTKTGIYHAKELNCVPTLIFLHLSANIAKSQCKD